MPTEWEDLEHATREVMFFDWNEGRGPLKPHRLPDRSHLAEGDAVGGSRGPGVQHQLGPTAGRPMGHVGQVAWSCASRFVTKVGTPGSATEMS